MPVKVVSTLLLESRTHELKRELCQVFRRIVMANGWAQKTLALRLGASERSIGYVVNGYVDRLTFNQIFSYLIALEPNIEIMISFPP